MLLETRWLRIRSSFLGYVVVFCGLLMTLIAPKTLLGFFALNATPSLAPVSDVPLLLILSVVLGVVTVLADLRSYAFEGLVGLADASFVLTCATSWLSSVQLGRLVRDMGAPIPWVANASSLSGTFAPVGTLIVPFLLDWYLYFFLLGSLYVAAHRFRADHPSGLKLRRSH